MGTQNDVLWHRYTDRSSQDCPAPNTTKQVNDLKKRGNELAAHGYSHIDMTTVNPSQMNFQLANSKVFAAKNGGLATPNFATPFGKSDAEVQDAARHLFRSMRSTSSGINTRQNFDPYNLLVAYIGQDTPLSQIQDAINQAKEYNGWLIFLYHRVENKTNQTKDSDVIVSPATFEQQLQLIQSSGITVKTVNAALDELQQ